MKAYNFLNKSKEFLDWKIVILFYSSLHDVDAFLGTLAIPYREKHPKNHKLRNKLVNTHLGSIALEYNLLYVYGRWVRYKDFNATQQEVDDSYHCFSTIHSYLSP